MSSPVSIRPLTGATTQAVMAELPSMGPVFLYKHSFRCGTSLLAREEVEAFAAARPDVPVFQLDVLAQRSVSQALATLLDVRHASPQAILLRNHQPVWSATHSRITASALNAAVAGDPEESTGRRAS